MPGGIRYYAETSSARRSFQLTRRDDPYRYPREQQHEALKTLLGGLERGLVGTLTGIGSITEDQALSDTEKVTRIRALPNNRWLARLEGSLYKLGSSDRQ